MTAFPLIQAQELSAHHPSVRRIQRAVAEFFGVPLIEMTSARRAREVARPRQVAMYLSKHLTPLSFPNIGRQFGNRDHTTIMHGVAVVERLIAADDAVSVEVEVLTERLTQ